MNLGAGEPRPHLDPPGGESLSSADLTAEASRLAEAAESRGVTLRLTGSAAIRLRFPDQLALLDRLGRSPLRDLDFFAREKQSKRLTALFEERGRQASRADLPAPRGLSRSSLKAVQAGLSGGLRP